MGVTDPSDCCLNPVLQVQILKETLNWGHQQLWQTAVCNSTKLPLFRGAMKFRQHGAAEQQRTPVQRAQTSPRPVSEKYITVQNSFLHMHQLITEKVVRLHLTMQFLHDPTDRLKAHKEGKEMKEWKFECSKQSSKYKNDYFKKSGALQQRDLPSFWCNNSYCSISHSITSGWQSSNCSRVQIKASDGGSCKRVPQKYRKLYWK